MTTTTNPGNYVDFDEYVGLKLEKTRSTIRSTDLLTALAGVAAMFLGYLLVFVILDQWVIRDGFGIVWRWILLSTLMISTVAWLVWKIGIPSFRTVNGLFAAREIEKAEPGLKSSLLNLIDLKSAGRAVNPAILKALERRAAVRLQEVDVSQAIDHRPLVRTAYVLLAVIVLFCLYALLSPKKISNSIWRGLLPAANVPIATRTEILSVKPGDLTVPAHTPSIEIQVDLAGEIPHQVSLLYTTADGRFNRQPVELRVEAEGQTRFKGQLVAENSQGLMQDIFYVIKAGDAESSQYKITVEQPPSADVETVRIEFPSYMKLEPVIQSQNGQIDAWEGAKVTVTAKTNMPVRSGTLQFLDDPQVGPTGEDVSMTVSSGGRQLQTTWSLGFRSDGSFAKYYRIDCRTEDDRRDTAPTNHSLTIRPDLPPEVAILQPERDLEAPANATIPILIQASDPDFELGYVYINADMGGQRIHREILAEGHQQKLLLKHDLALARFKPKAGDAIEIWAEAYDNKQPRPNTRNSPKVKIQILDPVSKKDAEQQQAEQNERREEKLAEAERDANADAPEKGTQTDEESVAKKSDESQRQDDPKREDGKERQTSPSEDGQGSPSDGKAAQQKKQATGSSDENPAGQAGTSKDHGKDQGTETGNKETDPSQPSDAKDEGNRNKPISSDGSEDDEAIKRLNEVLKPNNRKPKTDSREPDADSTSETPDTKPARNQQTPPKARPKNEEAQENERSESSDPDKDRTKSGKEESTRPKDEEGPEESNSDQPNPAGKADPTTKKPTEPAAEGDEPSSTDEQMKEKPKPAGKPEKKQPGEQERDPSREKDPSADSDKSDTGETGDEGDADKPEEAQQEQGDKPGKAKSNPTKEEKNQGAQTTPGKQPGSEGDETGAGKKPAKNEMNDDASSKPKTQGQQNSGKKKSTPDSDQSKPKPTGEDTGDTPEGPSQPAPDAPDAKKKEADGTEKGTAKPDRDPNSKPKQTENENVTRDPNETPETRPGNTPGKDQPKPREKQPGKNTQPKDQQNRKADPSQTSEDSAEEMNEENNSTATGSKGKQEPQKTGSNSDQKEESSENTSEDSPSNSDSPDSKGKTKSQKGKSRDSQKSTSDSESEPDGTSDKKSENRSDDGQNSSNSPDGKPDANGKEDSGSEESGNESSSNNKESAQKKSDPDRGKDRKSEKGQSDKKGGDQGEEGKQSDSKGGSQKGADKQGGKGGGKGSAEKSTSGGKSSATPGTSEGGSSSSGGGDVTEGDGSATEGGDTPPVAAGEDANMEYNKQATELILQKLKKELERGEVDPELLEQLGWTQDEMKQFADRLSKYLDQSKRAEETPEAKARQQQFQEMLKNLDLQKSGTQRSGEKEPKRDVMQIDSKRAPVPPAYRSAYDKFTRDMARQKPASGKKN